MKKLRSILVSRRIGWPWAVLQVWIFATTMIYCCEGNTRNHSVTITDKKKPTRRLRGHGHVHARGHGRVQRWEHHHRRPIPSPYCIKMYRPRKVGQHNNNNRELKGKSKSKIQRGGRWDSVPHVNKEHYLRHYYKSKTRSNSVNPKGKSKKGKGGIRKGRKYGKREGKGRQQGPVFALPKTTAYLVPPQHETSTSLPAIDDAYVYEMEWYYGDPMCYDDDTGKSSSVSTAAASASDRSMSFDDLNSEGTGISQEEIAMDETQVPTEEPGTTGRSVNFPSGFPCDSPPFTLNRFPSDDMYPQYMSLGDDGGLCFLRMTADDGAGVATTALLDYSFDESNVNRMFSMVADYRIYGTGPPGYGVTWLLHQAPTTGTNALGPGGGELAIYDVSGLGLGIAPALVVELDTVLNNELLDDSESSIHIMQVDGFGELMELVEAVNVPIATDAAGATAGRMWVDYCEDQILRVYINQAGDIKPGAPQAEVPFDMNSIFSGGQDFATGFSSSIGGVTNNHDILSWKLVQTCG